MHQPLRRPTCRTLPSSCHARLRDCVRGRIGFRVLPAVCALLLLASPRLGQVSLAAPPDDRPVGGPERQVRQLFDADEGLKPISSVRASIGIKDTEVTPPDYAAEKMTAIGPPQLQPLGYTRGFRPVGFGWDAPAVCFRSLYFEDINLERYGIHYGCFEIVRSTALFTKNCILLPYKVIVQPGGENIYTLGYERPNNCIPVHCYHTPWPCFSCRRWFERQCFRPYQAACPWEKTEGVCGTADDCEQD